MKCYNTIQELCGQYIGNVSALEQVNPTGESPHTQINNVYSMMWPNPPLAGADIVMQDDAWLRFLEEQPFGEQANISENLDETWSFS